jgi:hypothetical protein
MAGRRPVVSWWREDSFKKEEAETTLFSMGRYIYRAWVTNMSLTPAGIWHFYDGRAGMEPRIRQLREDFALRKIPTASFEGVKQIV